MSRRRVSRGPVAVGPQSQRKERFCCCSAASQNIRTVHCEPGKQKTDTHATCRIKASAPRWDRVFLWEGHKAIITSGLCFRRASLRQQEEPVPFVERSPPPTPSSVTLSSDTTNWQTDVVWVCKASNYCLMPLSVRDKRGRRPPSWASRSAVVGVAASARL